MRQANAVNGEEDLDKTANRTMISELIYEGGIWWMWMLGRRCWAEDDHGQREGGFNSKDI